MSDELPLPGEGGTREDLFRRVSALIANAATTAVLGFAFWILAARIYSPDVLGANTVLISSMLLLANLSQLNLGNFLLRHLKASGSRQGRVIAACYGVAILATAAAMAGFLAATHYLFPSVAALFRNSALIWWFGIAVALSTIFSLQDNALVALDRARWVPVENGVFGLLKFALLFVIAATALRQFGPFLAWTTMLAPTILVVNSIVFFKMLRPSAGSLAPTKTPGLAAAVRFVGWDYAGNVAATLGVGLMPMIVIQIVGPADSAVYQLTWTVATSIYLTAEASGSALLASAGKDRAHAQRLSFDAFLYALAPLLIGGGVVALAAPQILGYFRAYYAEHGGTLLRLLLAVAFLRAIVFLFLSTRRIVGDTISVTVMETAIATLAIGTSLLLLPRLGLIGAGWAWLSAYGVAVAVILLRSLALEGASGLYANAKLFGDACTELFARLRAGASQRPKVMTIAQSGAVASALAGMGVLVAAGLGTWAIVLIDYRNLTDAGLIGALPWQMWAAYCILVASFGVALISLDRTWLPVAAALLCLCYLLHLVPALAYPTLRYAWTWKHIGVVDYLLRHEALGINEPYLSAYHNWPGLFVVSAVLLKLARGDIFQLIEVAKGFPFALNALYAILLWGIYSRFTKDRRLIALALWLFLAGNWVGQDYYSPQGVAFVMYLMVLSLALGPLHEWSTWPAASRFTWLQGLASLQRWLQRGLVEPGAPSNGARVWYAGLAVLLMMLIAATHQLTPIALIFALMGLTLLARLSPVFAISAIMVTTCWDLFAAAPYLSQTLPAILQDSKQVSSEVLDHFVDLSEVTSGQAVVSFVDRALTVLIMALAAVGIMRRWLAGYADGPAAILSLAVVPVAIGSSYGGEVAFRVYFFALPFAAFLAAGAVFPKPSKTFVMPLPLVVVLLCLFTIFAFVYANNGKDRQYVFAPGEIQATRWLADHAPTPSLLVEGGRNYPSQFMNYEKFTYVPLSEQSLADRVKILKAPDQVLEDWLQNPRFEQAYMIVTRSQIIFDEDMGRKPDHFLENVVRALISSPRFKLEFASDSAYVFSLMRPRYWQGER